MSGLDYRTWGQTTNCKGCRYWSEMIAECSGGILSAMCVASQGPLRGKYTTAQQRCGAWREGSLGVVDQPGGDPYTTTEAQP